ncbi:hypothetical protein B0H66DRAFT_544623 [Apodospora peruviana]|uniref:Uncharacterized protein n=1 Tax=Apodospora peruviana TaxID=516989 RepID=A0AAE0MH14_9PEZI|nr:hypothetical protein B0H66DRAFT_544623 [Apodospora peruviana]
MVWTFDPASSTTTVIFLNRRRQLFPSFISVLSQYRNLIHTPSFLCFTLQWDQPSIVQDNLWVYWAFTLPITAAVFLIWAIMQWVQPDT